MQTLSYTVGPWHADVRVEEVETGKMLAVIRVTDEQGTGGKDSRHTVVFASGSDPDLRRETEEQVRRILEARYGLP